MPVSELIAFSDAELANFMKQHLSPNGGFELPVDAWDKLSADERTQLAERLRLVEAPPLDSLPSSFVMLRNNQSPATSAGARL